MTYLIDETAVYRRPDGVVRVSGPDRLGYLHVMLSQHLETARPGAVADFCYLDPKGNALAAGRAVVHAEHVFLVTPIQVATDLAAALEKFKFLMQVEAVDCSGDWAVASVRGPGQVDVPGAPPQLGGSGGAPPQLRGSGGAPPQLMAAAPRGEGLVIRDRDGGVDLVGPRSWVDERVADLELPEALASDWEAYRISAGLPGWGTEIVPGRRAQELGLLPTHVHLRKGCYPGQESIAKIYNLGRPRRALAVIEAAGEIAPGDRVDAGGKAGEVTSAAALGPTWVGLALLPVDREGRIGGGGDLTVGGVPARVRQRVAEGIPQPGA
ncbi:MAG: YgfZ/GcvT domain-containing protein [Egibacteraceae bacterium]